MSVETPRINELQDCAYCDGRLVLVDGVISVVPQFDRGAEPSTENVRPKVYMEYAHAGRDRAHLLEVTRWKRFAMIKHGNDCMSGSEGLLDGEQSSTPRKPAVCVKRMS